MLLELFKSLADETRLRILNLLARSEFTVQELTEILDMGQSRVSRHLKILHQAGLLAVKRQGTWSYYRLDLAVGWLDDFWALLQPQLRLLAAAPADLVRMSRLFERQKSANRKFFDRHAQQWDRMKQSALPLVDYRLSLLEKLASGKNLVEIGIGTGELLSDLAGCWEQIVGVDQSPAMLAEAGNRLHAVTSATIDLRLGEMTNLPVADAVADTVLMNMVLHHAPQPKQVLAEACRVLRPGGRLVVADLKRHDQDWVREALSDVWLGFTPDELHAWLITSGFDVFSLDQLAADDQHHGVLLMVATKSYFS